MRLAHRALVLASLALTAVSACDASLPEPTVGDAAANTARRDPVDSGNSADAVSDDSVDADAIPTMALNNGRPDGN